MNLQERLRVIDREILNQLIAGLPEDWSAIDLRVELRRDRGAAEWVHELASPQGYDASLIRIRKELRAATRNLIQLMEAQGHRVKRVRVSAWLDEEQAWAHQATLDYDA